MNHTPQQIADLARAALADGPIDFQAPRLGILGFVSHQKFHEACDPATILALCERLEEYTHGRNALVCPDPMTAPPPHPAGEGGPPVSDADKLRAVCRVVWPGRVSDPADDPDELCTFRVELGELRIPWYPDEGCMDDLRRVLLALTPGQVALFNGSMERLVHDGYGLTEHEALTAPTTTILDALHRAVCPE